MKQHEVHIFSRANARKLRRLAWALPDLRRNTKCNPKNTPKGSICFEYPVGREAEFESAARTEGLAYEWGIGGTTYIACFAVGDFIYALDADNATLTTWDVCDPENPVLMSTLSLPNTSPQDIVVYRGIAYVACASGEITAINVDDPTAPSVIINSAIADESWNRLLVSASTIFVGGDYLGIYSANVDELPAIGSVLDDGNGAIADIALQGRRLFVASASGTLTSYRVGGFYCPFIETGALHADEIAAEVFRGRHVYVKGEIVASQLTVMGGTCETDTGVVNVANYIKLGSKFFFWSDDVADPNTVFTATFSSLFLASDGSVWRNTDGASAWAAM